MQNSEKTPLPVAYAILCFITLFASAVCLANTTATLKDAFDTGPKLEHEASRGEAESLALRDALEQYHTHIRSIFKYQEDYKTRVREYWSGQKKLRQLISREQGKEKELAALWDQRDSKQSLLSLYEKTSQDLKKLLASEPPPAKFIHQSGYSVYKLQGVEPQKALKQLSAHLEASAQGEYVTYLHEERSYPRGGTRPGGTLKATSATVAVPLATASDGIAICKDGKADYYIFLVSEIYAVERAARANGSSQEKTPDDSAPMPTFIRVNETYVDLPEGMGFCQPADKDITRSFLGVAENHAQIAEQFNLDHLELWESFDRNQSDLVAQIGSNDSTLGELERAIARLDEEARHAVDCYKHLQSEGQNLRSALPSLEQQKNEARSSYLEKMANREIRIVRSEQGADKDSLIELMLRKAEFESKYQFKESVIDMTNADVAEVESITKTIQPQLVAAEPHGWMLLPGITYYLLATLTYQIEMPPDLVPIRDYEANIRSDIWEKTESDEHGMVYRDPISGEDWWPVAKAVEFGVSYDKALKFEDSNGGGWELPTKSDLDKIKSQESGKIATIGGITGEIPYWTADRHESTGDPMGYCFGRNRLNCRFDYKEVRPTKALAVLLLRKREAVQRQEASEHVMRWEDAIGSSSVDEDAEPQTSLCGEEGADPQETLP